jgi:hypothetical protein
MDIDQWKVLIRSKEKINEYIHTHTHSLTQLGFVKKKTIVADFDLPKDF